MLEYKNVLPDNISLQEEIKYLEEERARIDRRLDECKFQVAKFEVLASLEHFVLSASNDTENKGFELNGTNRSIGFLACDSGPTCAQKRQDWSIFLKLLPNNEKEGQTTRELHAKLEEVGLKGSPNAVHTKLVRFEQKGLVARTKSPDGHRWYRRLMHDP